MEGNVRGGVDEVGRSIVDPLHKRWCGWKMVSREIPNFISGEVVNASNVDFGRLNFLFRILGVDGWH